MTAAVLAVQGAFAEHIAMLNKIGVACIELRKKSDLEKKFDGIVLPGGESTVQGKLLKELDMFDIIRNKIVGGIPTLATCAGLILLAENIVNDEAVYFKTMPVTVRRNAYGRQTGSFFTCGMFAGLCGTFPMNFIRAPYIESVGSGAEVLAEVDGNIVAAMYKNQTAMSFHPELSDDTRIHEMFAEMMKA